MPIDGFYGVSKISYYGMLVTLMVSMISFSMLEGPVKNLFESQKIITNNDSRYDALDNSEVLQYCPRKSQVLVWGWSSDLFAYFDWTPVPGVVNEVARIKYSSLSESSIASIAKAISSNKTDCIFDATGPQYFGGFSPSQGFDLLPKDVFQVLEQNYSKNLLLDGTLVRSRN
jgi:hypothetical protein